jgi:D-alanyl-D-alanine carboxypeptidase/D-alanyl-D-alanine-endopeptidase (penicillin-binding protein 4)
MKHIFILLFLGVLLAGCGTEKQISKSAKQTIFSTKPFANAHVGISLYEPATNKYWYNYQGEKYFVPASNTKIATCYAAMKYLGDSILSFRVQDNNGDLTIEPCGDPSFLLGEFSNQSVFEKFKTVNGQLKYRVNIKNDFSPFGSGWSWDDYQEYYLAERSPMPIYGNLVNFEAKGNQFTAIPRSILGAPYMKETMIQLLGRQGQFTINRDFDQNEFRLIPASKKFTSAAIPFKTKGFTTGFQFLKDTLATFGKQIDITTEFSQLPIQNLYSMPTDSLLKPLMHRSDNFFAEQSLLMVSYKQLGYMNDKKIIDTLLASVYKDLPQRPRWADGSGLSRYNLFTPQDFVQILNKMQTDFGMNRVKTVFATGGTGTISSYYKEAAGYIFAKTGTLSGVVGFSGFLYTKKGKLLIFSTLVNNHQASATDIRRGIEKFLLGLREKY